MTSATNLETQTATPVIRRIGIHSNPSDVRLVIRMSAAVISLVAIVLVLVSLNVYQYWRRPDRVVLVVKRTERIGNDGKVLTADEKVESINNREYGVAFDNQLQSGVDRPGDAEKKLLASEFIKRYCQIDPRTAPGGKKTYRQLALEEMFRMMLPSSAREFAKWLEKQKLLDTEARETWQATWTDWEKNIEFDPKDPFTLVIQGRQNITKILGGQPVQETRRLQFRLKVTADKDGRTKNNMLTGLQVVACDYRVITE